MKQEVKVIGAGLAGCEAAWQLAGRGFSVTLNPPRPAWQYYVPTYWQMFQMLLYPGLAASLASLLWGALLHARRWLARR